MRDAQAGMAAASADGSGGGAHADEEAEEAAHAAEFITVPEAAERLRIGTNLAYELVARGEIPHIRIGRPIRIPVRVFERWIDERTTGGARRDQ